MLIKRIQAESLQEALSRVRTVCGENALLIETRRTGRGYLVVAAKAESPMPGPRGLVVRGVPRWTQGFAPLAEAALGFGLSPRPLSAVERALIGTQVDLSRPGDPALPGISARILQALIRTESLSDPRYRVMALVGPTGVGKTTTLAKLAARAMRDHQETVAIVTTDTYRVAAVEQLRAFADMLGVPFEVAFTPTDLRRAVHRHGDVDRVFIDTTGRSPYDCDSIGTLRGTLDAAGPGIALCLAAGTRRGDGIAVLEGFAPLGSGCLILTKWDETECPGESLSLAIERGIPIARITVGQEVPKDIRVANSAELSNSAFRLELST